MEGMDIWDPTAFEMLLEHMRRVNLVHRRRIAVLTGEADTQFEAAARAAEAATTMAEAAELAEFSPSNDDDDIMWLDETIWTEGTVFR